MSIVDIKRAYIHAHKQIDSRLFAHTQCKIVTRFDNDDGNDSGFFLSQTKP